MKHNFIVYNGTINTSSSIHTRMPNDVHSYAISCAATLQAIRDKNIYLVLLFMCGQMNIIAVYNEINIPWRSPTALLGDLSHGVVYN